MIQSRQCQRCLVGGQHFQDHAIVALVFVEGLDDPISPVPEVSLTVLNQPESPQAVPIAVAPHIHPMSTPALPVMRALQQSIDKALIGLVGAIF